MCTLSILPHGDGLRLAHSRDEARARPLALPPRRVRAGGREALLPLDPAGGGTWIAVTDAGLALALLNVNPRPRPAPAAAPRSRGLIIPALLAADDLDEACSLAGALDFAAHEPFRLILAYQREVVELLWAGDRPRWSRQRCEGPVMYTSSGLGDDLVRGPRSRLFAEMLGPSSTLARSVSEVSSLPSLTLRAGIERQDAFHRHSWPGRPALSVCMRRDDAHTVSLTTLTLAADHAVLTYHPGPPDEPAPGCVGRLDLQLAGVP